MVVHLHTREEQVSLWMAVSPVLPLGKPPKVYMSPPNLAIEKQQILFDICGPNMYQRKEIENNAFITKEMPLMLHYIFCYKRMGRDGEKFCKA